MFKGKRGQQLARDIGKRSRTFVPGAALEKKAAQAGAAAAGGAAGNASAAVMKPDIDAIKVSIPSKLLNINQGVEIRQSWSST